MSVRVVSPAAPAPPEEETEEQAEEEDEWGADDEELFLFLAKRRDVPGEKGTLRSSPIASQPLFSDV